MKFIVVYAFAIFGCISPLMGRDPSWFSRRSTDLENALIIENGKEKIAALGEFMSLASHGEMDEQQKTIFGIAQAQLIKIPGHAEYYRDRILQAQERLKNPGGGTTWSDYHKTIQNGFEIFPHLHSPEGVRVLGEMMSNDWVLPGNETKDLQEQVPRLSELATVALSRFPLNDKPFTERLTRKNYESGQVAWKLWYEQIKSGKRTFRFEGDPTEYDLNGPALGQKLAHISRNRKREAERVAGHKKTLRSSIVVEPTTASKRSKSMPVALFIAAMVLLVSMGWYFLRWRRIV